MTLFQYRYTWVILYSVGEVIIFEHGCYISALEYVRMLILSSYVLLACINTIYKYGHAWVILLGWFSEIKFLFWLRSSIFEVWKVLRRKITGIPVCFYSRHKHSMTCSERFNIQSEGCISQLWNSIGRWNLESRPTFHVTLISDFVILSDFKL